MRAVDLFSGGGGGWCLGLRALGGESIGLEWDGPSCATRSVVGLSTVRCDVALYPAERFAGKVDGVTGSPPCQTFSSAGKRAGMADPRGQLVHEPMRYVRAIRPRWVALEQVKEVLPYWRWIAGELREMGYSVWSGILNAADYGVPQVRLRAILLASIDRQAVPPKPTHSKTGHADMLGDGLAKWVAMADALGWEGGGTLHTGTKTGTAEGAEDYLRDVDRPACTVRTNSGGRWKLLSPGRSYTAQPRRSDPRSDPAPTIALGHNITSWCWERPATTVMTDQRVFPPTGHHPGNGKDPKSWSSEAIPVEPWELGVLQGFPADHPWQAPHVSRQIGNAIPPPLAEACLRSITGVA